MSAAGGGSAAVAAANFMQLSAPELKQECARLGLVYPSNATKAILQTLLRNHNVSLDLKAQMASMQSMQQHHDAQLNDVDIDDLEPIQCQICCEQYNDSPAQTPRLLPCGHTFCTDCLKGLFGQKQPHAIECPSCMTKHPIPRPAVVNVDDCPVVKSVPINFYGKEVRPRGVAFFVVANLTPAQMCARIKLLILDRQQSKQVLADAEQEKTQIRAQLGEADARIATLNAAIEAAALVEARQQEDFKASIQREAADAAAAKQSYEQEIAKLRAEISAHPAPNEKCKNVLVLHGIFFIHKLFLQARIAWAALLRPTMKAKTYPKTTKKHYCLLAKARLSPAPTGS
jgi:hypothetical protein